MTIALGLKALSWYGINAACMLAALAGATSLPGTASAAWSKAWTYSFTGGTDGANPIAGLFLNSGNLYGTAFFGGANGQGTLFSIPTSGGTPTILHAFNSTGDGAGPGGTPILDGHGNILGTTAFASINSSQIGTGNGTIYAYSMSGASYTVLHTFTGGSTDGANSYAGLLSLAHSSNPCSTSNDFYFGTTTAGGSSNAGTLFKLAPNSSGVYTPSSYSELLAVSAVGGQDAYGPLACDSFGVLYGTTVLGGSAFRGLALSITTSGGMPTAINQLLSSSGGQPRSGLFVVDSTHLLGTTTLGGTNNDGVVYLLTASGLTSYTYSTIYNFGASSSDGNGPWATLISADSGNTLYGTTTGGPSGNGTVFKLVKGTGYTWTYTQIYAFAGGSDGANPEAALAIDGNGNLYGTTEFGGASGKGTIFKLTP